MIKKFGNCTNDSSDGGFGRDKGGVPLMSQVEIQEMIVMTEIMVMMRRTRGESEGKVRWG